MKNLIATNLLALSLAATAQSKVVDIKSYDQSLSALRGASLVAFDIDNTLVRPVQTLGSDQWYGSRVNYWEIKGLSTREAVKNAIKEWSEVQNKTQVQLTEKSLPALIMALKARKIPVMALTARPIELADASLKQLRSVGISFADSGPIAGSHSPASESPSLYTNGILFVGPENNKGLVLQSFLRELHLNPLKIVFFDDKQKHVDSLEKVFSKERLEYIGFRYGGVDNWVLSFDQKLANKQFEIFKRSGRLVSDEEIQNSPFFR